MVETVVMLPLLSLLQLVKMKIKMFTSGITSGIVKDMMIQLTRSYVITSNPIMPK